MESARWGSWFSAPSFLPCGQIGTRGAWGLLGLPVSQRASKDKGSETLGSVSSWSQEGCWGDMETSWSAECVDFLLEAAVGLGM